MVNYFTLGWNYSTIKW